jgi:anti-sigma regulatory factor (Ser/Thr protein kinase)
MIAHLARRQSVVRGEAPWWLPPAVEGNLWAPVGAELSGLGRGDVSAKTARDFTVVTLNDWGLGEMAGDARLVVSELVTNAVRHAGQPTRLRLLHRASYLVCVVFDPERQPPMVTDADHFAESGRGLRLVESLSCSWGWKLLDGDGKLVWAAFTAPFAVGRSRTSA